MGLDHGLSINGKSVVTWRKRGFIARWMRFKLGKEDLNVQHTPVPEVVIKQMVESAEKFLEKCAVSAADEYMRQLIEVATEIVENVKPVIGQPIEYWEY